MFKKITILTLLLSLLSGCSSGNATQTATAGRINENMPLTRGQAVKMLALSKYSIEEINNMTRSLDLEDSEVSNWCDKYINAAIIGKLISGTQEKTFLQNDSLTLEQANFILKNAAEDKNLVLNYDNADRKKPISYNVWLQAFDAIKGSVTEKEMVFFADSKVCNQLEPGFALSDIGLVNIEGIDFRQEYINCGIKAYIRDNCVVALKEIVTATPEITGTVKQINDEGIYLTINGFDVFFFTSSDINLSVGEKVNVKIEGNKIAEVLA